MTAAEHISRTGMMAPPPDSDPAERPQPCVADGPELLDSRSDGLGAVNWCTGVGPDTGWLQVLVLRPDGTPAHSRGLTAFPGLYVRGQPWLSTRGSGLLYGVAADAMRIAQHVAAAGRSR